MTGYKVAPAALRAMATKIADDAREWGEANTAITTGNAVLGKYDLGLLGDLAGFVTAYQTAQTSASTVLKQGQSALSTAGTTLAAVAANYEKKDAHYYRKFGYMA